MSGPVFDTGAMPTMSDRPQPPYVLAQRQVLNMHWPANPRAYKDHRPGYPAVARIVFQDDGEAWLPGEAIRWGGGHVYVEVDDRRVQGNGVWLKPADVYRSAPDG